MAFEFVTDTFDRLVGEALSANDNFVYEGHFTNDSTWEIPKQFKSRGYHINMIFLGLADSDTSELRVINRVKEGGHFVPRLTVEDNFYGNLEKLDQHFSVIDNLTIIDTSANEHIILTQFKDQMIAYCVPSGQLPPWFVKNLKKLTFVIKENEGTIKR